jgi:CheY-like chemotaxis protein
VEDIDLNAEIVMDLLDMEEVSSDRAEDGEIAVKKISESQEHYYDAILMDLRMPHMDGLEAARTIRSLERSDTGNIPIIALTANIAEEDKQKVKEAGMDAHLSKPVDPDLLYETLGRLISRNRKSDYRNEPKED